MDRHYWYRDTQRLHYRRSGSGPALVLLPTFPYSSLSLEPLADLITGRTVIALDLPGTGESSPIPGEPPTITEYAAWLADILHDLGLAHFDLVAFDTSVPLAVAYAQKHPDRVRNLVLVEPPLLTVNERTEYLAHACPPLIPDAEGTHVARFWGRQRDSYTFTPWFNRSMETRILRDLPPANRLYDEVLDLFRAGPGYWHGSHAAWNSDWIDTLPTLHCPVTILGSPSSQRRVTAFGLNQPVLPISNWDDMWAIAAHFGPILAGEVLPPAPPPPLVLPVAGQVRRDYANTRTGQVLVRRIAAQNPSGKRPLVLFHGSLWSSAGLEAKLLAYSTDRSVVTFDIPGVGDSPAVREAPDMPEIAAIIGDALDDLGIGDVDLQGGHSGAMIAIDVAIKRPDRVKHVILDGVTMFSDEHLAEMLPRYLIPLRVTDDGSFLLWAWHFLRDMYLWYPWYDHRAEFVRSDARVLDPEAQHRSMVDFLKGGRTYPDYYRAAIAFPTRTRLPLVTAPTLLCCSLNDILRLETEEAVTLMPNAVMRYTQGRATKEATAATDAMYLRFLDDLPISVDNPPGAQ